MSTEVKRVQPLRGTTGQLAGVAGLVGELIVDTDRKTVTVHDGETAGGYAMLREDGPGDAVTVAGRTLAARAADVVNVLDEGARSDLLFDSRPAFLRAIQRVKDMAGGVLYIPSGSYRLDGTLTITGFPIRVLGDGLDMTQLYFFVDAATHGFDFSTEEQLFGKGTVSFEIEGVRLTSVGQCGTAIRCRWGSFTDSRTYLRLTRVALDTVPLHQSWTNGVHATNANGVRLTDVRVKGSVADATQLYPYSMDNGVLFDETDGAFGKINHYVDGLYVENANHAFSVLGWYEGWYINKGEMAFVGDGFRVDGHPSVKNPVFTLSNYHINARATPLNFKNVHHIGLSAIKSWREGGAHGTARPSGNSLYLENCGQVSVEGSALDCALGADNPSNGVLLAGTCDTVQIVSTAINGHSGVGIAAVGTVGRLRADVVITNCGQAVNLGPSSYDTTIKYRGSGNLAADVNNGSNNVLNNRQEARGRAGERAALAVVQEGAREWTLEIPAGQSNAVLRDVTAGQNRAVLDAANGGALWLGTYGDDTTGATAAVKIIPTLAANRQITLTGSNGGNPLVTTSGGDLELAGGSGTVAIRQGYTFRHTGSVGNIVFGSTGAHIEFTRNAGSYLVADGPAAEIVMQVAGASQVVFKPTAAANRQITLTGSNGGNPSIGTNAGGLTISARLRLSNLPTSSAGLSTGDLWSDGGTIKVA